ncbi:MAG: hypothetical protein Unbinned6805contig1000_12 [Prokaryotic dsDNA virus sp.]|nr:MAG: hypothetical protein Unbinned6805contig1000_12 [Prokaryotic dsDNA virus sp.]|tara:strand:- start:19895 stop:20305 length:411 start_codon:yes stop_codon:yes gene_type:complete
MDKPHNGGKWTPARFHSFIKSALRRASMRWPPKHEVKKAARVERGKYLCNGCGEIVPASIKKDGKRKSNVHVDHVVPVIDPAKGFVSWDDTIERMFCEAGDLQVLCTACHAEVTAEERLIAKERKQLEKNNNDRSL